MYKYLCQEVQIRSRLRTRIRKKRLFLETHTNRQVALHGFLPNLLGDGYTGIEKVCGEEKYFIGPTGAASAEQKSLAPARQAQRTN
jgi:hypothetical protein